ncbi:cell wall-associated hydrolase [Brevibacterium yomogidense]|uniref:Putative membrane protein n=1 Tax=Brevibacterium yomogidense TaxID=946573 RepID=A0A1X6XP33_9MICO|nr:cell wall-associated hydrolase [Brevibacterium yomogidense]SLN00982.1 putative membrane protein [Brevibacterium yomogidense]
MSMQNDTHPHAHHDTTMPVTRPARSRRIVTLSAAAAAAAAGVGLLAGPAVAAPSEPTGTSASAGSVAATGGQGAETSANTASEAPVVLDQENADQRQAIIDRARHWTSQNIAYSMYDYFPDPDGVQYRTDCSGFVSMAWGLDSSLSTVTLPDVAHPIAKEDLQPGDILLKGGPGTAGAAGHVTIFEGWTDESMTSYNGLEQAGATGAVEREIAYPYDQDDSYVPYRLNGL